MSKEKALKSINKVIKQVEDANFSQSKNEFDECVRNAEISIRAVFGPNSSQLLKFINFHNDFLAFHPQVYLLIDPSDLKEKLKGFLRSIKYEIENFWEDEKEHPKPIKFSTNKIFIIHGHDKGTKNTVARFLENIDLDPIILHEQPNEGKTLIEKLEKHLLDAGFAIALLTPDDVGAEASELESKLNEKNYEKFFKEILKPRARQNVIFELGLFIGALGRNKVCVLYVKNVEILSDYEGVLYIPLDKNDKWKSDLAKELETAGFKIDKSKLLKAI